MNKRVLRRKINDLLGNVPEEVIEFHYINPITNEVTVWFSSPAPTGAKIKTEEPNKTGNHEQK